MNFFKNMNRKKRREFDKLTSEQKVELAVNEIKHNIAVEQSKQAAQLFLDGYLYRSKMLKRDYLDKITGDNDDYTIEMLFMEIRQNCVQYDKMHPQAKGETESENT